ncbi:hypothetical protein Tco_0079129, partial [Tanacetum coccineum]
MMVKAADLEIRMHGDNYGMFIFYICDGCVGAAVICSGVGESVGEGECSGEWEDEGAGEGEGEDVILEGEVEGS